LEKNVFGKVFGGGVHAQRKSSPVPPGTDLKNSHTFWRPVETPC